MVQQILISTKFFDNEYETNSENDEFSDRRIFSEMGNFLGNENFLGNGNFFRRRILEETFVDSYFSKIVFMISTTLLF